jgi:hypothetical protein
VLTLEELRVLDRDRRLPSERLQESHVGRPEALLRPTLHHQNTYHPLLVVQWDAEPRAEPM